MLLEPVAPDRVVEHLEIYYAAPDVAGPDWAAMRAAHVEIWRQVFLEDVFVVEGMQKGRAAPGFDGGTRSEEHTSELQSLMRISYAVFCLKTKTPKAIRTTH